MIALAVKLTSRGPVIYRSIRPGIGCRPFHCLKFRTMRVGADDAQDELEQLNESDGALFKIRDDPRLTSVGRVLRRFSLDELPQMINVLRGEMSLVGPRPLPMRDFEKLEEWHKKRYLVLPGITGLWQVSGRSELTSTTSSGSTSSTWSGGRCCSTSRSWSRRSRPCSAAAARTDLGQPHREAGRLRLADAADRSLRHLLRGRAAAVRRCPTAAGPTRSREHFLAACRELDTEGEDLGEAGEIAWFPDRSYDGRTYVPAVARTTTGYELFGFVSFGEADDGSPERLSRRAPTSPRRPPSPTPTGGWISTTTSSAAWRGEKGKVADMTLVWGVPMIAWRLDRHRRARRSGRRPVRAAARSASRWSHPTTTAATTWRSCSGTAAVGCWPTSRSTSTTARTRSRRARR